MTSKARRRKPSRATVPSRSCQTPHCPGRSLVIRRKNYSDHITRRLECELCGLRTTSIERLVIGTTTAKERADAIKKLAAVQQAAVKPSATNNVSDIDEEVMITTSLCCGLGSLKHRGDQSIGGAIDGQVASVGQDG